MIKAHNPHALLARAIIDKALTDYRDGFSWAAQDNARELGFDSVSDDVVAYLEGPEFEVHARLCHLDPRRLRRSLEEKGIL